MNGQALHQQASCSGRYDIARRHLIDGRLRNRVQTCCLETNECAGRSCLECHHIDKRESCERHAAGDTLRLSDGRARGVDRRGSPHDAEFACGYTMRRSRRHGVDVHLEYTEERRARSV
jgi:hypothetical protein